MEDQAFCIEILPAVSRTFALSIEALPEPLRRAIRTSYLLCRIVDTIEDEPDTPDDVRQRQFDTFAALLQDAAADPGPLEGLFASGDPDSPDLRLCRHAGAVFREYRDLPPELADAARPHILEMTRGMAEYAGRFRGDELMVLRDMDDLERYCFFVAGTVGNLLTSSFVADQGDALPPDVRQALSDRAVAFGLGLQLTNIVKDVRADRARGWCFLPRSVCERHGIAPEDLLDPQHREAAMAVVREVADRATGHLDRAQEYTLLIPAAARDVRLFVLVPLVLALATLTLVRRSPEVLAEGTVKVSRGTLATAMSEAVRVVADDAGIRELCRRADALEI